MQNRTRTVDVPVRFAKDTFSDSVTTNLLQLPRQVCEVMYNANVSTAVERMRGDSSTLVIFLASTELENPPEVTAYIFVLAPVPQESEIVLGANLMYDRLTSQAYIQAARAIQYEVVDSYAYTAASSLPTNKAKLRELQSSLVRDFHSFLSLYSPLSKARQAR